MKPPGLTAPAGGTSSATSPGPSSGRSPCSSSPSSASFSSRFSIRSICSPGRPLRHHHGRGALHSPEAFQINQGGLALPSRSSCSCSSWSCRSSSFSSCAREDSVEASVQSVEMVAPGAGRRAESTASTPPGVITLFTLVAAVVLGLPALLGPGDHLQARIRGGAAGHRAASQGLHARRLRSSCSRTPISAIGISIHSSPRPRSRCW